MYIYIFVYMCVFSLFSFGVLDVWTLLTEARIAWMLQGKWLRRLGATTVSMVAQWITHLIQRTTSFKTWIVLVALLQSLTESPSTKMRHFFQPSPPEMKTHPAYLAQFFKFQFHIRVWVCNKPPKNCASPKGTKLQWPWFAVPCLSVLYGWP